APVALGLEIAEPQFGGHPVLDPCDAVTDFPRDELLAAPFALVVEEYAAGTVHAVAFAIVHRDPVTVDLGHAVRAARIERRLFGLRHFLHLAEHLAARRLIEANVLGIDVADRLQNAGDT